MNNLVYWASRNVYAARWLIFLLSLFSAFLFFTVGLLFNELSFFWSTSLWCSAVMAVCYSFYSYKKESKILNRTIINFSLAILWLHFGNQSEKIFSVNETKTIFTASVVPIEPIKKTEDSLTTAFKKQLNLYKIYLGKNLGKTNNLSPVAAFFIFSLLSLLALVIAFFLAIISCSMSCSGQMVISYVLLVNAAIFASASLFFIIYAIYRVVKKSSY